MSLPWILVLVLLALAWPGRGEASDTPHAVVDLEVFTRAGCPRCAAAERFLTELQRAQSAEGVPKVLIPCSRAPSHS